MFPNLSKSSLHDNPYQPTAEDPECACEQSTYWATYFGANCPEVNVMYWYHPDYLGSVEAVTDINGEVYQFFHNTIWGEPLQQQKAFLYNSFSSRYRFNGKERDWETGNFYYGARYYDPKISVWLSVDPLAGEAPYLTPYRFSFNNSLRFIDPTGLFEGDFYDENDNFLGTDGIPDDKIYVIKTSQKSFKNGNDIIRGAGLSKGKRKKAIDFVKKNSGNTKAFQQNPKIYDNFVELPGNSSTRNKAMNESNNSPNVEVGVIAASQDSDPIRTYREKVEKGYELPNGNMELKFLGQQLINKPGFTVHLDFHSHPALNSKGQAISQPPSLQDVTNGLAIGNSAVYGLGSQKIYLHNNIQVNAIVHPNTFRR